MWRNVDLLALTGRMEQYYISVFVFFCLCWSVWKKTNLGQEQIFLFRVNSMTVLCLFGHVYMTTTSTWQASHFKYFVALSMQSKFMHFYIFLHIVCIWTHAAGQTSVVSNSSSQLHTDCNGAGRLSKESQTIFCHQGSK